MIQDIVTNVLESEGYKVIGARFVLEDLLKIEADLILLDEWINKREGYMLCKEIKAISALARVPVIIFSTANNIIEIVKTCGADGYVQKPFELDTLLAEIKKFLPMRTLTKTA